MDRPEFAVSTQRLRAFADMFDIAVSEGDLNEVAAQLSSGLSGLAALRALDLKNVEPFVTFPVDRVQS